MAFRSLIDILTALSLTSGLKICVDAGDASSYNGTGQTFSDRSGNGNDFNLGTTSSVQGTDPTFHGSSGGLSAGEYFQFDGGDTFTIIGTDPLQSVHKDSAKHTILAAAYIVPDGSNNNALIGDQALTNDLGFRFVVNSAQRPVFRTGKGGATDFNVTAASVLVPSSAWAVVGESLDETVGSNGGLFFVNGATETFTSTYPAPSASNAAGTLALGGAEGATSTGRLLNGSRIGWMAVWTGVTLTAAQIQSIYLEAGLRFGCAPLPRGLDAIEAGVLGYGAGLDAIEFGV